MIPDRYEHLPADDYRNRLIRFGMNYKVVPVEIDTSAGICDLMAIREAGDDQWDALARVLLEIARGWIKMEDWYFTLERQYKDDPENAPVPWSPTTIGDTLRTVYERDFNMFFYHEGRSLFHESPYTYVRWREDEEREETTRIARVQDGLDPLRLPEDHPDHPDYLDPDDPGV